jgi:AraC family transcriptional regulator
VFQSADFDLAPYADFDLPAYVRRTYCSRHDAGWRSLLVQSFDHAPQAEQLPLPAVADLHLVLYVAGDVVMGTRAGGKPDRRRRVPGSLELLTPRTGEHPRLPDFARAAHHSGAHSASATVDRLGGRPDFEMLSAAIGAGDPIVENIVRALPAVTATNDLYAASAAAFLATHLLTQGHHDRLPGPEHSAVRAGIAVMKERLAPLTLAAIAAEAHLSVYHFIRVFRAETGETPHRFLTRLRIERAQPRCAAAPSASRRSPTGAVSPAPGRSRRPS